LQPLKFTPILKRIRWGGRRLGELLGKSIQHESDYAESWEVCDHGADQSLVAAGDFHGWPLRQLVRERAPQLLGRHAGIPQFPLLIKFLDAHDRLSLQVHPDDAKARAFVPGERGKTEAWVIIAADPGSCVFAGLQPGVTETELRRALSQGTVERCLHRVAVSCGDFLFIPAGTVHAIGEGIVLAEVQQSSDLTFRLFDWNRLGADGLPRELHVEQSLACIDFSRGPVNKLTPAAAPVNGQLLEELVNCPYFTIRRHTLSQSLTISADHRCHTVMGLVGDCDVVPRGDTQRLQTQSPQNWSLQKGETILIPASALPVELRPRPSTTILEVFWE
jgi:mannose-6-phosphate isomerase